MTREELVSRIAKDAKITKVAARACVKSFIANVTKTLKSGGRVTLVGFGTFKTSKRKARMGRNPQTGKALRIAARTVARFKAGSDLSKAVR